MTEYDIAVVGLGVLGSAAAYYAARKGAKVIAFEQFEFGHVHGSSHDTSRIVRTSYDKPEYVALAKAAYKDWAGLEEAAGVKLLHMTGGLTFISRNSSVKASDYARSLDANNVPYELIGPEETKRRWPQFKTNEDVDIVYTSDSGMVHANRTVSTLQNLARGQGAVLREHTRVDRLIPLPSGQGTKIETSKGSYRAKKVILAADAWTNKLLQPLGTNIPLSVSQEQVTYFKPSEPLAFESSKFPIWIYFGKEEKTFYGFPSFGEPTIKIGRDAAQNFMTPEQRTYVHSPKLLEELNTFVNGFIPDGGRQELRTVTCQYTTTIDRNFIISPLERHPDIIVALGAAHAFKFAPAIGRVLAELAIDGKTQEDISQFVLHKPSGSSKL